MGINAPYNFVPVSNQVVFPEWGKYVSHDLPFKDGVSGELTLKLQALSSLMVGDGKQTQGNENDPGEVRFFRTANGKGDYAIPGSSLRGMIRNVLEIATFSRMNRIDDKRYGLRDISGKAVSASYTERVRDNVKAGFLQLNPEGKPTLTPCSMVRLDHRKLEAWWSKGKPIFSKKNKKVSQKYQYWQSLCKQQGIANAWDIAFDTDGLVVTGIDAGSKQGFPVLTGQISDATNDKGRFKGKYKDFVFYDPRSVESIVLEEKDPRAWRDFLFIHGDEIKDKQSRSWPDFWKQRFWQGMQVPVFYIETKERLSLGLAYMLKLAGDFSTYDLLKHTHEDHVSAGQMDFASLLFGQVGDTPEEALKGRVFFEPAVLQGDAHPIQQPKATVLNGAKPSYFPNYIYQPVVESDSGKLKGGQYATYVYHQQYNPAPELRGWKRYPVRSDNEIKLEQPPEKSKSTVQTKLHVLEKGAEFEGRLVFHNLKPVELGALLWSLQLEGNRHSLGMGKSFGYGQVSLAFEIKQLDCNDPSCSAASFDEYIGNFRRYMDEVLEQSWDETSSIQALTAMADGDCRDQFAGELRHMRLDMDAKVNDFVQAKQTHQGGPCVLASYVDDKRVLKKRSHVSVALVGESKGIGVDYQAVEEHNEVWEAAKIHYNPGAQELVVSVEGKANATMHGVEAKALIGLLSKGEQKKAKKGLLTKAVKVEGKGNNLVVKEWHE